jgi:hypothetical protein
MIGHRMFEKDLARDRASDGKEDETEYKERHNFSSARATGRAMKNNRTLPGKFRSSAGTKLPHLKKAPTQSPP